MKTSSRIALALVSLLAAACPAKRPPEGRREDVSGFGRCSGVVRLSIDGKPFELRLREADGLCEVEARDAGVVWRQRVPKESIATLFASPYSGLLRSPSAQELVFLPASFLPALRCPAGWNGSRFAVGSTWGKHGPRLRVTGECSEGGERGVSATLDGGDGASWDLCLAEERFLPIRATRAGHTMKLVRWTDEPAPAPDVSAKTGLWLPCDGKTCTDDDGFVLRDDGTVARADAALDGSRAPLSYCDRETGGDFTWDGSSVVLWANEHQGTELVAESEALRGAKHTFRRAPSVPRVCPGGAQPPRPEADPTAGWDLYTAVEKGQRKVVEAMLARGADPNATATGGPGATNMLVSSAPLHAAAGNPVLTRLLLEHGAKPDPRNAAGDTPLLMAARGRHVEVVKLLLQHGADANAVDKSGQTALRHAQRDGSCEVEAALRDRPRAAADHWRGRMGQTDSARTRRRVTAPAARRRNAGSTLDESALRGVRTSGRT